MKTVLVCAQKGGVGKTMIANEIAYSLDRSRVPYNYYDLDPQGGAAHETVSVPNAVVSVVDTPGYLSDDISDQMMAADVIVIPTRASMTDREPFQRMLDLATEYAPGKPIITVVNEWNQYTANTMYTDWLKSLMQGDEILLHCVPHSEAIPRAGMADMSVLKYSRRNGPKRTFDLLRATVNAIRAALGLEKETAEEIRDASEEGIGNEPI